MSISQRKFGVFRRLNLNMSVVQATNTTCSLLQTEDLNSCVIKEKANAIIAKQGWLSLEAPVHTCHKFWPSLTLLFWYKLLKTAHVYVRFLIFILKRVNDLIFEHKLTFKIRI